MPESIQFRVRFVTPAFLGGADQSGQWRTPPFKALLREWWRVWVAASKKYNYDHQELRRAEGLLFGHAWLNVNDKDNKTWAMQGQVKIKLDEWKNGTLDSIPPFQSKDMVCHEEVDLSHLPNNIRQKYYCKEHQRYHKVDPLVYLGFGPHTTKGLSHKAVNTDESGKLIVLSPKENLSAIQFSLNLIHWFGTMGGRSRNGWGSIMLEKNNGYNPPAISELLSGKVLDKLKPIIRPLDLCLQKDWPHALGSDRQDALLWKSKNSYSGWSSAMQELARVKIAFRTKLDAPVGVAGNRHILAYPITNHKVKAWLEDGKDTKRLANQLRFKVVKDNSNTYTCLAYHLPCGLPESLQKELGSKRIDPDRQLRVWQEVHNVLDKEMQRITPLKEGGHDQ